MPDGRFQGWLATIGVALIAGVWRFWHISRPRGIIFDETYYTVDARDLLQNGVEHNRGYLFTVHPPLGKWMIAFSEWIFGFQDANGARHGSPELGWRAASAVAGTVAVLLLARAARRMFRSTLLGCPGGPAAGPRRAGVRPEPHRDPRHLPTAWIVAALACLVVDRDDGRRRLAEQARRGRRAWRRPRARVVPAVAASRRCLPRRRARPVEWPLPRRRRVAGPRLHLGRRRAPHRGHPPPLAGRPAPDNPALGLGLVVTPVVVYTASWTGWFLSPDGYYRHARGSGIFGRTAGSSTSPSS